MALSKYAYASSKNAPGSTKTGYEPLSKRQNVLLAEIARVHVHKIDVHKIGVHGRNRGAKMYCLSVYATSQQMWPGSSR